MLIGNKNELARPHQEIIFHLISNSYQISAASAQYCPRRYLSPKETAALIKSNIHAQNGASAPFSCKFVFSGEARDRPRHSSSDNVE